MRVECTKVDFTGQDVYVGIDVAKRSWKIVVTLGGEFHKRFSQEASPRKLVEYLRRTFPGARYHCVYEAGFSGYGAYEEFKQLGVDCIVVHAADVPTSDKERRYKNDSVDARKLSERLGKGELKGIYVPERQVQEDRTLVRMRTRFVWKQTRTKNQIKSLLEFYGMRAPEEKWERHWSRAYICWLQRLQMKKRSGQEALGALLEELLFLRGMVLKLTRQIRELANEERYREVVRDLCTVPGISMMTAMILATEIVDIGRFRKLEQLASYVGLIPGEHSTGESERSTGLTSRRNARLRHVIIEAAWVAQREDPAMLSAFAELSSRMSKNEAIVRIAHKLLNRVRYVWKNHQPYETGVLRTTVV